MSNKLPQSKEAEELLLKWLGLKTAVTGETLKNIDIKTVGTRKKTIVSKGKIIAEQD